MFPNIAFIPGLTFFLWPWVCQLGNPRCLSLACAPTFERNPLKRVLAPRTGRVVIECRPKGAPKPTFTWSKDTELLSNSTRWEETFANGELGLTVSQRSTVRFVLTVSSSVCSHRIHSCSSWQTSCPWLSCSFDRIPSTHLCSPSGYCCILLRHQQALHQPLWIC